MSGALAFRPDIEGLRAVAILLVVLAHAGVPGLSAGFVGVDAFFVLSGYLITRLLAHESRPSALAFYAARLRRLLPALLLVFGATCLAAMALLAPMEQIAQARLAPSVPLWLSNFSLAARAVDYFGAQADELVFQHTWSLSLEEQFYLAWPWLLMLALGTRGPRVPGLLGAVLLGSLAWCLYATARAPIDAYYLLPTRAWQFALGGVVALRFDPKLRNVPSPNGVAGVTGMAGAVLLVMAMLIVDARRPYPGWQALLPSLATAALLVSGTVAASPVSQLLALKPMQWLGRLSYGWYLWHWPVLLLGATLVPDTLSWRLSLAVIALLLAWMSHHAIEHPLRESRVLKARPAGVLCGAMLLMALAAYAASQWQDAAARWQEQPGQSRYLMATADLPALYGRGCDDFGRDFQDDACVFGPPDAPRTLVVLGDSIGLQWFEAIVASLEADTRLVVLTRSACPMVDVRGAQQSEAHAQRCAQWRERAYAYIERLRPAGVLVGWSGNYTLAPGALRRATGDMLDRLATTTSSLVLIAPTPLPGFDGPACLARRAWRPAWLPGHACEAPLMASRADEARDAAQARGIAWLAFDDLVCPDGRCRAELDGRIVYRDRLHLSGEFVRAQAPAFARRLREAQRNSAKISP